jgi:hypothetical protein
MPSGVADLFQIIVLPSRTDALLRRRCSAFASRRLFDA